MAVSDIFVVFMYHCVVKSSVCSVVKHSDLKKKVGTIQGLFIYFFTDFFKFLDCFSSFSSIYSATPGIEGLWNENNSGQKFQCGTGGLGKEGYSNNGAIRGRGIFFNSVVDWGSS